MPIAAFLRIWLACVVACFPLLALLLTPELMRSRAGSEQLLMIGTFALLALLVAAFIAAPWMGAIAAPVAERWTPRVALAKTRAVWRSRTGSAWLVLAAAVLIYAAAQAVGYWVGTVVPSVSDNPAFGTDASEPRWLIDYPAYVLQALTIYSITTLAIAWYGWRMRTLSLASAGARTRASETRSHETLTGRSCTS
ncbi:hypothetical protein ESP57_06470 [Agromyces fucosus]|uniref:Uncharacterized protein n=1 Tax=Agromyces fucosus TaxID=41985 RepID=A0A4Q2JPL8_9MICO|nr:hypothetical protein [Agromyces fucosus]RXZ48639.1 hypothetical protein ESP57_06470 [Agromyces fucosus]